MDSRFSRSEMIFGEAAMAKLRASRVAVFGIGGVGGYTVEALARSGVGRLDLIDFDKVALSNINRQIYALESTLGMYKVDVSRKRVLDINPDAVVTTRKIFYLPDTAGEIDLSDFDYVVDAIDTVTGKVELIVRAVQAGVRVISSMGAGNKLDITSLKIADIYQTSVCPLARIMRHELRRRGVESLKVVYSTEPPVSVCSSGEARDVVTDDITDGAQKDAPVVSGDSVQSVKNPPGSNAFVPAAAGLIIASEVVKDLIK